MTTGGPKVSDRKSIEEINERLAAGKANVCTEVELWRQLKEGLEPSSIDLEVLITAFSSSIRGSAAMVLIPVAERGVFTRARKIWLNGVQGHPGPAPNERLGVVDTLVFADQRIEGESDTLPAGTRLMIDLFAGSEIQVKCLSEEGDVYHNKCRMNELEFASMITYNTFLPKRLSMLLASSPEAASTVAAAGSKMLLNGAPGIVIGCGSRSRTGDASFSLSASMFDMSPKSIGRDGDDVTISVAMPMPVVSKQFQLDICNLLLSRPDPGLSNVKPIDADAASYLKELVTRGRFQLTAVN
jgi:uncharacterized protein (DUF39 family)